MLALKGMPGRKVGHARIVRKPRPISLQREVIELEADECQPVLRDEVGNPRDRQAVLTAHNLALNELRDHGFPYAKVTIDLEHETQPKGAPTLHFVNKLKGGVYYAQRKVPPALQMAVA